jgi:hypothetical protein
MLNKSNPIALLRIEAEGCVTVSAVEAADQLLINQCLAGRVGVGQNSFFCRSDSAEKKYIEAPVQICF